ncbi:MAG: hypothetical protein ABEI74_01780 [Candidatus Pacearchaeota archaeon]
MVDGKKNVPEWLTNREASMTMFKSVT